MNKRYSVHSRCYFVPCPRCGAKDGAKCVSRTGKTASTIHSHRGDMSKKWTRHKRVIVECTNDSMNLESFALGERYEANIVSFWGDLTVYVDGKVVHAPEHWFDFVGWVQ